MSYQAKQYQYQAQQYHQAKQQYHQAKQYRAPYQVPEKNEYYYDDSPNPIEEICKYTDNLENIQPEIRYRMLSDICRNKSISVYGDYAAPPNKQIVDQINGQGGYFLKMTAEAAGIYLIWYYQAKERYLFWGPTTRSVRDAMNRIRGRIVKYVVHLDRQSANEIAYDEDTYDAYTEDEEELEYIAPVPPTFDEQFGKVSQEQMNKMGFISGKGLGRKHTGRTDPINPIKDIGGRMYNRRYGLGYTKPLPVPVPEPVLEPVLVEPVLEPVPAEPVPAEPVLEPVPVPNKACYSPEILEIFSLILNHENKCEERGDNNAWN